MSTIVTRAGKGSALTHNEVDANFTNLNTDKIEANQTVTLTNKTISGSSNTLSNIGNSSLTNSSVTIGSTSVSLGGTAATVAGLTLTSPTVNTPTVSGGTINNAVIGGTTAAAGTFTSLSDSGNLTFTGTGARITGDFSNATVANRVAFQTSTTNGSTIVNIIPNGTSNVAAIGMFSASDVDNCSTAFMQTTSTDVRFTSSFRGTGTNLPMTFYTGGSERMRIDTSGNVGIGTSSPSYKVDVRDNVNGSHVAMVKNDSTGASAQTTLQINVGTRYANFNANYTSQYLQNIGVNLTTYYQDYDTQFFRNNAGTVRAVIDSSGNVGIGTSSPSKKLDVFNSGTTTTDFIVRNGTVSLLSFVDSGAGYTGTSTNHPLLFTTNNTERARIDSSGNLLVGTTSNNGVITSFTGSASGRAGFFMVNAASSLGSDAVGISKFDNNTTTSQVFVKFFINNNAAASGLITASGANQAAFTSSSDSRLKENIVDLSSQLANIMALRPVEFDYIESEGGGHQIGFIAQEVQEIYPDVVGTREDGMLLVSDFNKNDARLIKAIQELKAELDATKAKVAALEEK